MGVILMLITIGGLVSASVLFVFAVITRRLWLRNFLFGGSLIWLFLYGAMLLGTSVMSAERLLGLHEPKEFCGFYLDCHIHAAVSDIKKTSVLGGIRAKGEFYILSINIYSNAGRATLRLNNPNARIIDASGRQYDRSMMAEAQIAQQPEFDGRIGPEESFVKQIVFDLPADIKDPRLDISEGNAIDRSIEAVLIGDEDSIFHARTYFKLSEPPEFVGVK